MQVTEPDHININADDTLLIIDYTDNGNGVTKEQLAKLFDPFFTTKPVGSGTGLGLYTSYQIVVERHSGELKCLSNLGHGTEFIIKVPIT